MTSTLNFHSICQIDQREGTVSFETIRRVLRELFTKNHGGGVHPTPPTSARVNPRRAGGLCFPCRAGGRGGRFHAPSNSAPGRASDNEFSLGGQMPKSLPVEQIMYFRCILVARVLIGVGTFSKLGGGPGPRCSKPHLPPKSIFSSDFGHFIFASMLKSVKKNVTRKKNRSKSSATDLHFFYKFSSNV